jgi:hypothetical protein
VTDEEAILDEAMDNLGEAAQRIRAIRYYLGASAFLNRSNLRPYLIPDRV